MNNLRIYLMLACVCFLFHEVFSQETKLVVVKNRQFVEEYSVLKNNKQVLHGNYIKYRMYLIGPTAFVENGSYDHGSKSGSWQYFYLVPGNNGSLTNSLKEEGNYANGKKNGLWTTFYLDTTKNDLTFNQGKDNGKKITEVNLIQKGLKRFMSGLYLNGKRINEWTTFNESGEILIKYNYTKSQLIYSKDSLGFTSEAVPVFNGGRTAFIDYFVANYDIEDIDENSKGDSSHVVVSLSIDKLGRISSRQVTTSDGRPQFRNEVERLVNLIDEYWLPGLRDGQPIEAIVRVNFKLFYARRYNSTTTMLKVDPR